MSCTLFGKGGFFTPSQVLVVLLLIHIAAGLKDLEVFRLIAYESDGTLHGSKTTALDSPGAHYLGITLRFILIYIADDILRKLALIRISELTKDVLTTLLDRGVTGILILLPENRKNKPNINFYEFHNILGIIPNILLILLVEKMLHIPVYATWETSSMAKLYQKLFNNREVKSFQGSR